MEKATVEVIDNSAIINISLSGAFYSDLQYVLKHLSEYKSEEELSTIIDKINNEAPPEEFNEWEIAIRTLLVLCAEVEGKAREQNAIKHVDIDLVDTTTTAEPASTNI